jgi:acyl-CoA thioester hydrolase
MRWADMDLLGHVNNVVYVDYLQEARVDMLRVHAPHNEQGEATGDLAEGLVVVRHEVHYRAPLTFRFKPVSIECWVTDIRAASFTMAYEVFHEDAERPGGRRVYLRASTVLTPFIFGTERPRRLAADERSALAAYVEDPPRWLATGRSGLGESRRDEIGHYPVHVRFSDVDVYGHVNNVKYFEYFMEARILFAARLWKDLGVGGATDGGPLPVSMVVAQTDVDYKVPIHFRPEAYDAWSWLVHVGDRSMVIASEICDGDRLLSRARVAMVFVDPVSQRPAAPPPEVRERLLAAPGVSPTAG